jgi:hypothetical protein
VTIAETAFDAAAGALEIAPIGIELYEFRAA